MYNGHDARQINIAAIGGDSVANIKCIARCTEVIRTAGGLRAADVDGAASQEAHRVAPVICANIYCAGIGSIANRKRASSDVPQNIIGDLQPAASRGHIDCRAAGGIRLKGDIPRAYQREIRKV